MRNRFLLLVLLVPFGPVATAASDSPVLARLASLAGDWSLLGMDGKPTDLVARYRVVAGGAAVTETLFPGTPEETVTVYHREGSGVTATVVSAREDPVRLAGAPAEAGTVLKFTRAADEVAVGRLVGIEHELRGEDSLRVTWLHAGATGTPQTRVFDFRRDAALADLAAEVSRLRADLESLGREIARRRKREVDVEPGGARAERWREIRTLPPGPGWSVVGTAFRPHLHDQTVRFASTWAADGDAGMTVGHYGFKAGRGCRVRFSVLGGHGYIAVVEERKTPPRWIASIPEFSDALMAGEYGPILERIVGGQWSQYAVAVEWDFAKYEGKALRLYVVDAVQDHYGQIAISEVSIVEQAK